MGVRCLTGLKELEILAYLLGSAIGVKGVEQGVNPHEIENF
jgi:hypothetical protein